MDVFHLLYRKHLGKNINMLLLLVHCLLSCYFLTLAQIQISFLLNLCGFSKKASVFYFLFSVSYHSDLNLRLYFTFRNTRAYESSLTNLRSAAVFTWIYLRICFLIYLKLKKNIIKCKYYFKYCLLLVILPFIYKRFSSILQIFGHEITQFMCLKLNFLQYNCKRI